MAQYVNEITEAKKRKFLEVFAEVGIIGQAARAAGVDRGTYYYWTEHDEAFSLKAQQAKEMAADNLEAVAMSRAVEGTLKPVFGSGGAGIGTVQVGNVREYSDVLLMFLLNGMRPEKYKRYGQGGVGADGVVIKVYSEEAWKAV